MNFDHYLNNPELRGWLRKKSGTNIFGFSVGDMTTSSYGWKRYWFCVMDTRLMYYTNEQAPNTLGKGNPPIGIISLHYATSIQPFGTKGIKINFPEVVYELEASEIILRSKWVLGISKLILEFFLKSVGLLEVKTTYTKIQKHTGTASPFGISKTYMRKEGALDIRSGNSWKPRYFVLVDGMLLIFSAKGATRNQRIPLYNIELDDVQQIDKNRFSFKLKIPSTEEPTEMEISHSEDDEVQHWVAALLKHKLIIDEVINNFTF